jgi:hypothetical protein
VGHSQPAGEEREQVGPAGDEPAAGKLLQADDVGAGVLDDLSDGIHVQPSAQAEGGADVIGHEAD